MKKPQSALITLITVICGFYLWELFDPSIIKNLSLQRWDYLTFSNEWYRLFTVALLHDTSSTLPYHLAFNMMALHSLGNPIEQIMGKAKFLTIFFLSLLAGSLSSALFLQGASIGASGAVFGLFGAFIALGRRFGSEIKSTLTIVAINFAVGFTIGGVDWRAHLGGLVGGFVITKVLLSFHAAK